MNAPAYIQLGPLQLALAAALIVINLGISVWLRLGLARNLLVASARMVVQLLLVGFILDAIFALRTPWPVLGIGLVMAALAGWTAVRRTRRRFRGIFWDSLLSILGASFVVTGIALVGVIHVRPWFLPQYAIPLLGMVLGNLLTGVSLALDRFMETVVREAGAVEADLALGATRWEAAHPLVADALRTGLIPTINAMMVMGLVSLPGMMTGQMLAGAAPASAVRYQIVIMFVIAATTALGTLAVCALAFRALFNARHQLCLERLRTVERKRL
ncbi:MAG: iron export ABC transporter permease subunit FetB [Burkholderiaceae bacterium]|jgi:putative ABC transport system permease protein|nr:MAG: iron export ABC transporter permease subunit FetB [Burkholderiaceae bacterium]